MKALIYEGPGRRSWATKPDPAIQDPTDVIVRIDSSTICGTDLHILKGDVPEGQARHGPRPRGGRHGRGGRRRRHHARPDDRVLVSCITSCGRCAFCREGHYGLCTGGGGWIFGHLIDGLQAELARGRSRTRPFTSSRTTLTDEQVLFLADILPTAFEVGVLNGGVKPGDTVAIVGAGPIGLAAILTAKLYTPSRIIAIDLADARLARALEFGADAVVNNGREDAVQAVLELTDGLGADVAMEAVGVPETFELCTELIRPGGRVANIGVHGHAAALHLETLWIRDVTITTGLVDTDDDAEAPEADRRGPARRDAVRDPSVCARGHDGGVRHVRRSGEDRCVEGRARGRARGRSHRGSGRACRGTCVKGGK